MTIDIFFGDRRSGRTTRLIEWLIENEPDAKRVLIVHAKVEADRVFELVQERCSFVERWQIVTPAETDRLRDRKFTEVGIDNLELFLPWYGAPITMATATQFASPSPYSSDFDQPGFKVHTT